MSIGAEGKNKGEDASENSGIADIMEIAAAIDSAQDASLPPDESSSDELESIGGGYGGVAAASLVRSDSQPIHHAANDSMSQAAASIPSAGVSLSGAAQPPPAASPNAGAPTPATATGATQTKRSGVAAWLAVASVALVGGALFLTNIGSQQPAEPVVQALAPSAQEPATAPPKAAPAAAAKTAPKVTPVAVAPASPVPPPQPAASAVPTPESSDEVEVFDNEPAPARPSVSRTSTNRPAKKKVVKRVSKSAPTGVVSDVSEKPAPAAEPEPKAAPAQDDEHATVNPLAGAEADDHPAQASEDATQPTKATPDKYSTDCLLHPNAPGCAEAKKKAEEKALDPDANLPQKLSQTQIRAGISPFKAKAKACGPKHGIAPGTKVRVKLSISGSTGKVVSASAMAPYSSEAVGKCVASVLGQATFSRFKKSQLGTVYPVSM